MEAAGILIDLSHASPELFWDVAAMAEKPLVASHSNAKKLCGHPRNLTDEQFEAIRHSGGVVGLNFFRAFLNDQPEKASMWDVLRHAEHFLSMGGEDALAMGGDWDGARLPGGYAGACQYSGIVRAVSKALPPDPGGQNLLRKRRPPVSAAGIALTE